MSATVADQLGRPALPRQRTLVHLVLGGAAGLGLWEMFSATITEWVAGFPLQPPELVKSLFQHLFGLTVSNPSAVLLHGLTGILFYPLGYWLFSRRAVRLPMPHVGLVWGAITYVIALGFFAPLAGQPFLLHSYPALSAMSFVGHVLYGYVAALVFERLEAGA